MPRRRQRGELGFSADINVTSLVDVVLTLLVIFMITAPMMQGGVEVAIPRARTQSVAAPEGVERFHGVHPEVPIWTAAIGTSGTRGTVKARSRSGRRRRSTMTPRLTRMNAKSVPTLTSSARMSIEVKVARTATRTPTVAVMTYGVR